MGVNGAAGSAAADDVSALVAALQAATAAAEAATSALAAATAASLQKSANLTDLTDAAAARSALGLGTAATRGVGTSAGTVAAGNDGRLSDARAPLAGSVGTEALGPGLVIDGGTP